MIGIKDPWVVAPYILSILSALLCLVWGILKWNKGGNEEPKKEIKDWAEEEDRVENEF